jgi:hypothetical protein
MGEDSRADVRPEGSRLTQPLVAYRRHHSALVRSRPMTQRGLVNNSRRRPLKPLVRGEQLRSSTQAASGIETIGCLPPTLLCLH